MDAITFDDLSRHAADLVDSNAFPAANESTLGAQARRKKKCKDKCKSQAEICKIFLLAGCDGGPECAKALQCCKSVGRCQIGRFFNCLFAAITSGNAT